MVSPKPHCDCEVKKSCPLTVIAYNPVLSIVVKEQQIIPQKIHPMMLTLQKTHLNIKGYINIKTSLNTKLKKNNTELSKYVSNKMKNKQDTSFKQDTA